MAFPTRFIPIIYRRKKDQVSLVEIPELSGCMANGVTYEQAVANAQSVIVEWIEICQSLGGYISNLKACFLVFHLFDFFLIRSSRDGIVSA